MQRHSIDRNTLATLLALCMWTLPITGHAADRHAGEGPARQPRAGADREDTTRASPEAAAWLGSQQSALRMFSPGKAMTQAGTEHAGTWIHVDSGRIDTHLGDAGTDLDSSVGSIQLGNDLWHGKGGSRVGILTGRGRATSTARAGRGQPGAITRTSNSALGLYTQVRMHGTLHADAWLQHQRVRHRLRTPSNPRQDVLASGWTVGMQAGMALGSERLRIEPGLRLAWTTLSPASVVGSGGEVIHAQDAGGLSGLARVRISTALQHAHSQIAVLPYAQLGWLHDVGVGQLVIDDTVARVSIPRNRLQLSTGATLRLAGGFRAWLGTTLEAAQGWRVLDPAIGASFDW